MEPLNSRHHWELTIFLTRGLTVTSDRCAVNQCKKGLLYSEVSAIQGCLGIEVNGRTVGSGYYSRCPLLRGVH